MKIKLALSILILCQGFFSNSVFSESVFADRFVFVNGQRMTSQELVVLDALACSFVPNGSYWVRNDGVWGYAGNANPVGKITGNCYNRQDSYGYHSNGRRKNLSERGLLYSPGELLR